MTFTQFVLREVHCPRCNAIAQERLEDRSDSVIIVLWCGKCKLKRNVGLTSRKALKLRKRQQRLRELLSQAKSPLARSRLEKEIELLELKISRAEIGI